MAVHRQLIPEYRGQLPLAHQAAIMAAGLPSIAVAIALVETRFQVSAWTWVSVAAAMAVSTILPFLVAVRPRLAVVLGAAAAAISPGAIPVLAFVGNLGLRTGRRRTPWLVVPLIGSLIALGFAVRYLAGVAPSVGTATFTALIGVCIVLGGARLILRPKASRGPISAVDSDWLSRRIHDGVGQRLALLGLRARVQASGRLHGDPHWDFVADEVEGTFAELRRLLDEIEAHGGATNHDAGFALDEFIVAARRAGAPVLISGRHLLDRMEDRDADLVAAVVREGVSNAAKYAGPGHVHVRLVREPQGAVTVAVRSPLGPPMPTLSGGGHGLAWLRRRVEQAGGSILSQVDGSDFVLSARVPMLGEHSNLETGEVPRIDLRAVAG
jgi:hypothetical protein